MFAPSRKVQTAFRLDRGLLERLKMKAQRENRSLNSLVEESLMKLAPAEPDFPKLGYRLEVSPSIRALTLDRSELNDGFMDDEKVKYILAR